MCEGTFLASKPLSESIREPFLLIVRTSRIVTAPLRGEYRRIHRMFQQIARLIYVTTLVRFIVTAAVYWGFDSELRLAANPSS